LGARLKGRKKKKKKDKEPATRAGGSRSFDWEKSGKKKQKSKRGNPRKVHYAPGMQGSPREGVLLFLMETVSAGDQLATPTNVGVREKKKNSLSGWTSPPS